MSIKDRINQIQQNSVNWRHRVNNLPETERDAIPGVTEIRRSLNVSQGLWKDRVPEKDVSNFTVDGRIKRPSSWEPSRFSSSKLVYTDFSHRLPVLPIMRATSKENRPASKSIVETELSNSIPSPVTVTQKVTVHAIEDDTLMNFFTSPAPILESNASETPCPPVNFTPNNDRLPSSCHIIARARRAVRPERRKPQTIRSHIKRNDQPMEYEEVRPSSAVQLSRTITPFQRLLNPIDPATRISQENDERRLRLADSALAGLGSTENFSDVKRGLRRLSGEQPLSELQRQLLPYKPIMLLQIKGRRHVQVRLVCPSANSLNSGDCFVLITVDAVYVWLGGFANVVEINKARELASWIHKHHELSFRDTDCSSVAPIVVQEDPEQLNVENENTSSAQAFWRILGYEQPQAVQACGAPDEDELHELLIQRTNRVYEVTPDQLVPVEAYWGNPLKHSLLASNKAFVFDFGSEVYLWTGAQISSEVRHAGKELVNQAYAAPYDYSSCGLNPLDPLSTHPDISTASDSRPNWTLVGRVTEKGETVLFKEKFIDWPDSTRIGIQWNRKSALGRAEPNASTYSAIQPYSADELYQAAFNEPAPDPVLLTLDGRFVGRGGEGCRCEDGIPRRYRIDSGPLRVWHISEFSRTELPEISHGQFYTEDTYVIRWAFKVIHVGMREVHTRLAESSTSEQCAYFFWQGSQSKRAEKGAAALMTVELDEERGPQLRVPEGNEPPAFCRLFDGRMVIHVGKRGSSVGAQPRVRLFLVRGEFPAEGHLLEVPPRLSSLRPQGAFLALHYATHKARDLLIQKVWLWCGRLTPEASLCTAHYIVEKLRASCPPELGTELKNVIEVQQTEDKIGPGELIFLLNSEDHSLAPLCVDVDRGRDALTLWQLGLVSGRQLHARRLTYPLQPDATLAEVKSMARSTPSSESNPLDIARAVSERLRSSVNATIAAKQNNSENFLAFPFLLSELYEATQPAIFLLVLGKRCVYLWQGWWPMDSRIRRLSAGCSSSASSAFSPFILDDDCVDSAESINQGDAELLRSSDASTELSCAGSARGRFSAFRQAALKTARDLASKIGCRAVVVYSGLEPLEFLCLFPPYERDPEAALFYQREEGKVDGQIDSVESLLLSSRSFPYTLIELQQRPLPGDLDATNLEVYLSPEEFQGAFSMTKEEFAHLPTWKKVNIKKRLGLF